MKTKVTYIAPDMEQLELGAHDRILTVSGGANWGENPGNAGGDDNYSDGDY